MNSTHNGSFAASVDKILVHGYAIVQLPRWSRFQTGDNFVPASFSSLNFYLFFVKLWHEDLFGSGIITVTPWTFVIPTELIYIEYQIGKSIVEIVRTQYQKYREDSGFPLCV